MYWNKIICICLIGIWHYQTCESLRITNLDVPKNAWDAVTLNCRYDLEGEQLYAVKWYKDDKEFFRCFADGSVQKFPLEDIKIYYTEPTQVGSCFFELTALTTKSGGIYTCEVSLDWPTFKTVTQSSTLKIIQPQKIMQTQSTESTNVTPSATSKGSGYLSNFSVLSAIIFIFTITKMYFYNNYTWY